MNQDAADSRPDPGGTDAGMHAGQLTVSPDAVRALVAVQFPRWAGLGVRKIAGTGTVNAIFRLGDDLTARFPLQPGEAAAVRAMLERERDATAEFAGLSPFPAPRPVAIGHPGDGFPLPWSVQTWVPGTPATDADAAASPGLAADLAALIATLRAADTGGRTFDGDNRGGDLRSHDAWMATCLDRSAGLLDVPRLRRLWSRFRELPRQAPDRLCHRDLIPGNVLVQDGRLAGVLDTGGFGPADPALDLVAGWHLLDDGPRAAFRAALGVDDVEWERGAAWAFEQSMGVVWYYDRTNPAMSGMGRRTLGRILATHPGQ